MISKEEWMAKCAAQFTKVAELNEEEAMEQAAMCFANTGADNFPEDAADDEMSYWSAE